MCSNFLLSSSPALYLICRCSVLQPYSQKLQYRVRISDMSDLSSSWWFTGWGKRANVPTLISGNSCLQLPGFKLSFALIALSAIRIQLKQGELPRKVAEWRVVKGASKENAAPKAETACHAVANSNWTQTLVLDFYSLLLPPPSVLLQIFCYQFTSALAFMMWKNQKGGKPMLNTFPNCFRKVLNIRKESTAYLRNELIKII